MTLNVIDEIFGKLSTEQKYKVAQFSHIVNDPLSRRVLAKLASPHTPMCLDDMPIAKLQVTSPASVLSKLNLLERAGLVYSEMAKHDSGVFKTYHATEQGKETVVKYMKAEAKQFA